MCSQRGPVLSGGLIAFSICDLATIGLQVVSRRVTPSPAIFSGGSNDSAPASVGFGTRMTGYPGMQTSTSATSNTKPGSALNFPISN